MPTDVRVVYLSVAIDPTEGVVPGVLAACVAFRTRVTQLSCSGVRGMPGRLICSGYRKRVEAR